MAVSECGALDGDVYLKVLLIGSYNGQDSFGDECLLSSVIAQMTKAFGGKPRFVSHIEANLEASRAAWPMVTFSGGFAALLAVWRVKLRHLHLPFALTSAIAFLTFPLYLMGSGAARRAARQAWTQIGESRLMYFYGGTQLSQQWYTLNMPGLLLSILACRLRGVPVYFGPQQYGPQSLLQRTLLRAVNRFLVKDIRVRNASCQAMLGLSDSAVLYDEVYSCAARYPVQKQRANGPGRYLLINCRGSNFLRPAQEQELFAFVRLVAALQKRMGAPLKLFQMSSASFCDDTLALDVFRREAPDLPVETIPYNLTDHELIELAGGAAGTLSMSFHGCILSMIGGAAAVPVTSGGYYDHKYVDFDKYSGGQNTPLVCLDNPDIERVADTVAAYFAGYRAEQTAATRTAAARRMEEWYARVGGSPGTAIKECSAESRPVCAE